MRIAVVQHRLRRTERHDLAALLSLAQKASDEGAGVIACPCVPGLSKDAHFFQDFAEEIRIRVPHALFMSPCLAIHRQGLPHAFPTSMGRTMVLIGDECIDEELYPVIEEESPQAMLWQLDSESDLQAEALLEYAIEASSTLSGLVLVASTIGEDRGLESFGGSAIVHAGDILAEAREGEDVIVADIEVPVVMPERRRRPHLPPILAQRAAVHRGRKLQPDYPADLS